MNNSLISTCEHQDSVALLFNQLIQSYVLFSLNNLEILSYLEHQENVSFSKLSEHLKLSEYPLKHLIQLAENYGIIKKSEAEFVGELYSLTPYGKEAYKMAGFFTWAIGGYGQFLTSMEKLCKQKEKINSLIKGDFVAKGSDECYFHLMQHILFDTLSTIPFSHVADLGCGSAGKLIQFARRDPCFRGIGIDINQEAINLARQNVKAANLENQIELICSNVLDTLNSSSYFPKVETLTSFMMMHDFFNIPNLSFQLFDKLKTKFPDVRYFVIGDTVASKDSLQVEKNPIFTRGFELIHQFMGVQLFSLDYYLNVFESSGLTLERVIPFGIPNTYLFVLKV